MVDDHKTKFPFIKTSSTIVKGNKRDTKTKQKTKMMNQNTSRLSPLAKPFTLNRSSSPKPSSNSDNHDDPFSSLLDSFRQSSFSSKGRSVSLNDTVKISTLPAQGDESLCFEEHPFLELHKNGDFEVDVLNWSHFEVANSASDVNMFQKGSFFMQF